MTNLHFGFIPTKILFLLPGAENALKLVSEAHMILCDHVKRSCYDIKRQSTQLSDTTLAKRSGVARHIQAYDVTVVFWSICPHCKKRFVYHQRNLLVSCDSCGRNFFALKLNEQTVPSRFLSAAPNHSQVSPEIVSYQHLNIPDQLVQYTELLSAAGSMDSKPIVDSRHTDEHIKWHGNSGDYREGSSVTRSNVVQCSAVIRTHSLSPSADKGTAGSMMAEAPYPDVVANQDFSREYASTVPNAAGSCNLQILSKRKQGDCADSSHSMDSCNNKRQSKGSLLSGANSSADKMDNRNVAGADNQDAKHVPDTMDIQGEINATHEGNQQKYKKEVTDIANQMHGNPVITYKCADSNRSRDSCNNKSQMKDNSLTDANSCDDNVCRDNVAGLRIKLLNLFPVHWTAKMREMKHMNAVSKRKGQ